MNDTKPALPLHPDPHSMTWTDSERRVISDYADQRTAGIAELEGLMRDFSEYVHARECSTDGQVLLTYSDVYPFVAKFRAALASTSVEEPERGHSAAEVGEGQKARRSWPAQGARSHTPREAEMATAERGDAGGQSPASSAMPASPPVVQPDAVATLHDDGCFTWKRDEFRLKYDRQRAGWRMDVYASHPHAEMKTLTDAEISELWRQAAEREYTGTTETLVRSFARAYERALAAKNGAKNAD